MSASLPNTLTTEQDLVVIQRNPTSGSGRGRKQLLSMIRRLRSAGMKVRLFADRDRFDSFVAAASEQEKIRCLVAAGGDGTVASLANRHSRFPIAVLPLGTENLVARHLGISRCGTAAAEIILKGLTRVFDTAFVNNQRFLLMVSTGVDADIVRRLSSSRTGNITHSSYISPIVKSFLRYNFPSVTVHGADGAVLGRGTHVVVTNIPEYGFRMPFAPLADPHDGKLDIRIFQQSGTLATIRHAVRTRLGGSDRPGEVLRLNATEVEISAAEDDVPVQFDGDPGGFCPVHVRIAPASMTLVVRK